MKLIRSQRLSDVAEYACAARVPADAQFVFLAGSCPLNQDGSTAHIGSYSGQAGMCIENLRVALEEAGAAINNVVSTRVLVASAQQRDLVEAWEVARDAFGEHDVPERAIEAAIAGVTAIFPDQRSWQPTRSVGESTWEYAN